MAKLEGFRLVNIHANHNSIIYPNEYFNLSGGNTLLDMANGGGKTLAAQMLFQTILPNSRFKDSHPVLGLFSGVARGSTVHVISHFSIEGHQFQNLYLGFAAMAVPKNGDESSENTDLSDMGLKYMNYIIVGDSLAGESLSIKTLPVCKTEGGKALPATYKEIKEFLQTKAKSSSHGRYFAIKIFENEKTKYEREIKNFGINKEVFELLQDVNRGENYLETFFESECKRPKDLFMNFLVPQTKNALDSKSQIMGIDKVDQSSQLAESLFEKSQSLNELNAFISDKASYEQLRQGTSALIDFIKGKITALEEYQKHIKEYPMQMASYAFALSQIEEKLMKIGSELVELNGEKEALESQLENIGIRRRQIEIERLKNDFKEKAAILSGIISEIKAKEDGINKLEAINLIIEYKDLESQKNGIEERLEKLTNIYYDEKRVVAEFANTISLLAEESVRSFEGELGEYVGQLDKVRHSTDELKKKGGALEHQSNLCSSQISKTKTELVQGKASLAEVSGQLEKYENYSQSLLDDEEIKFIEVLKLNLDDSIEGKKEDINQNSLQQADLKGDINTTNAKIEWVKEALSVKEKWMTTYQASLDEIKVKTPFRGGDIHEAISQIAVQIEETEISSRDVSKEIRKIEEEISILEDYGFLRSRSKYDALNTAIGEWGYGKFGSDILKELDEDRAQEILSKFPGFAEVLVVTDDDFQKVSSGKKNVSVKVSQENFVLMPQSAIKQIEEGLGFGPLFLLTRDGKYYTNLLDSVAAINTREKEIEKLSEKAKSLEAEKAVLNTQLELLRMHNHQYQLGVVEENTSGAKALKEQLSGLSATTLQQEQKLRTLKNDYDKLTGELLDFDKRIVSLKEKHQLLIEKIKVLGVVRKAEESLSELLSEEKSLSSQIEQNNAGVRHGKEEESGLQKAIERTKINLKKHQEYFYAAQGYKDNSFGRLESSDIANLLSKFSEAKKDFDAKTQNYDELVERQQKLKEAMENIKSNFRFEHVSFSDIYESNYTQKISAEEFKAINSTLEELGRRKELAEEEKTTLKVLLNSREEAYQQLESKITIYFEKYMEMDELELSALEREAQSALLSLTGIICSLFKEKGRIENEHKSCELEVIKYQTFCTSNSLDWKTSGQADMVLPFNELNQRYVRLKEANADAIRKIDKEMKRFATNLDSLTITEQLKVKLKEYLINKQTYEEINQLINRLEQTSEGVSVTIKNIQTSIENIGRLDEEIAEQVYRMLKTILDEIEKIPEYSKFKYGDYTRESFILNLKSQNGCRVEPDIALNRIKSYVYELAHSAQNDGITKKEIANRLSIENIMKFGVDFDKLSIKLLKLDEDNPKPYDWGKLTASSAQSYLTYLMFVITIIKYFNSVTLVGDKMKAPIFLFLDNPFASASSVSLWEPVKRFLDKCNAQLFCIAHNPPAAAQILFDKHILVERSKNSKGQIINSIRNEKSESTKILQMGLFDHPEID